MYRIVLTLIFLYMMLPLSQAGASRVCALPDDTLKAHAERLFEKFKAASRFDYTYPREKVYLHLDNTSYFEDETIWYKAYVVRASTLRPTTLSRVLYVELLNADGQLMEKQTLKLDTLGQADGSFRLKLPIRAGYYEVRAYTREMANWGTAACYSRIVPVFTGKNPMDARKKELASDILDLSLPEPAPRKHATLGQPRPYVMKEANDYLLTFYPEGGHRAKGVSQRIAYKLTDGRGKALADTLAVCRDDGTVLLETVPVHEGMGRFTLPSGFAGGYVRIRGESGSKRIRECRYDLPKATAGIALSTQVEDDGLYVGITANDSAVRSGSLLGLAVICREKTCYFDTLTLCNEGVGILIPRRALRQGVHRVELFDAGGHSRSTRIVWIAPAEEKPLKARVRTGRNRVAYEPYSPAAVRVEVTDSEGRPLRTRLSVAVRDRDGNITETNDGGVSAALLLSSEVQGYIARPDLYFVRDDESHRLMTDLLLMVQGWTANRFEVMCGTDSFRLVQPIEDRLILRGKMLEWNRSKPQANYSLLFQAYASDGGALTGETVTDSEGKFAFESQVDFCGDYIAQFTTRNDKGKRRFGHLTLDRWFSPPPRPFYAPDLSLHIPVRDSIVHFDNADTVSLFTWDDTLKRSVPMSLGEVEVEARKYRGFTGGRYTWNGGVERGMKVATRFYNVEQELERMKDMGVAVTDLNDLFCYLDGALESDRSAMNEEARGRVSGPGTDRPEACEYGESSQPMTLSIKGKPTDIYINNDTGDMSFYKADESQISCNLLPEEIKAIAIVDEPLATDAVTGGQVRVSRERQRIYIYEQPEVFRLHSRKRGVERRHIQGYTVHTDFYSPNYNTMKLPDEDDRRRTLYWNPSVDTDATGKATVTFFTNGRDTQYLDISVRGITPDGLMIE